MEDVERVCKPLTAYKIHPFIQQTRIEIVCYDTEGWGGGQAQKDLFSVFWISG